MKRVLTAAAALAFGAGAATAGGLDRSGQFMRGIFEETGDSGHYLEFSAGTVSPSVSTAFAPLATVDPLKAYQQFGAIIKRDFSDQLSFTLIFDQPYGANINYAPNSPGFATLDTTAVTGVVRYKFNDNWSVHGGVRAQHLSGSLFGGFGPLAASNDFDFGALVGVAYERPDIALRVALTYNSKVTNHMTGTDVTGPVSFDVVTPDSWNLEFQTGVAADTLVFGSIRYALWDGFNITSPVGTHATFTGNTTTYSLGVGRKFNEKWSGAVTVGYEAKGGPSTTLLAPTTGQRTVGLAMTYTEGNTKITGGVSYGKLGEQTASGVPFNGGDVFGVGVRIGFKF